LLAPTLKSKRERERKGEREREREKRSGDANFFLEFIFLLAFVFSEIFYLNAKIFSKLLHENTVGVFIPTHTRLFSLHKKTTKQKKK
tara:strand:+ start:3328 stop:3588 length:261 start_codon:yes stop_codon:yes gene_type:complete